MAHFAEIDSSNKVLRVLVVPNKAEAYGQVYLADIMGLGGTWIQTSYNSTIRKNFAGIGFSYDADRDAFIPPQPYPSWVLNEKTCQWEAPVKPPKKDPHLYSWNEDKLNWELI
jgi:hypothetical protein